ncbi:MAG: hypothetical protein ACJ0FQ_05240 [Gammaproteobacteria bacterium]
MFKYIEFKLKLFIALICIISLASCQGDSKNSNLELNNFIKPEYSFKESSLSCMLVAGSTLNSVERFIPKFIDSYSMMGGETDELYFLFPVIEAQTETQSFELVLRYQEAISPERLNNAFDELSFDNIATCGSSSFSSRSLWVTQQTIYTSPVISEILECEYLDGFNYATMKLVLEQFINALNKNNSPVDILFSQEESSSIKFQWTNIFPSLESREEFVESWQALEISKEIQELLLEQSICQSSQIYRSYKVL